MRIALLCFKLLTDISRDTARNYEIRCPRGSKEKSTCDVAWKQAGRQAGEAGERNETGKGAL